MSPFLGSVTVKCSTNRGQWTLPGVGNVVNRKRLLATSTKYHLSIWDQLLPRSSLDEQVADSSAGLRSQAIPRQVEPLRNAQLVIAGSASADSTTQSLRDNRSLRLTYTTK